MPRPLNEAFDIAGSWYLPENPEHVISGTLHYTSKGAELDLYEAFRPIEGTIYIGEAPLEYLVIHGTTIKGEAITILNAIRVVLSLNIGSGGMRQPERLTSYKLFMGAHLTHDFTYPEVRFRVPSLQVWLSRPIITGSSHKNEDDGRYSQSYRIQQLEGDKINVPLIDAKLEWKIIWESKFDRFTEINVVTSAWVTIKPSLPKTIDWYFEQQRKISAMLTFLAGTSMSLDCIEASIGNADHHSVSILPKMNEANLCAFRSPDDFFIPRSAITIDFAEILTKWFQVYPNVEKPSQLAVSIFASKQLWIHIEFLSLMQALEGFHRGLFEGKYIDDSEYDEVKRIINDSIPTSLASDHKDALRSRIRYGNQISLSKRLDKLSKTISEPVRKIIFGDSGNVPRSWIDTRNYYTHWDEELRSNILDNQSMYGATVRMSHFLRILYIQLMGMPEEAILRSLNNTSEISRHLQQINSRA